MGSKRKRGICTYCGKEKKLTRDHVFPKSLFIKSDPEMLTVPACNDCNQVKSRGDSDLEIFANLDINGSSHADNLQHIERIIQRGQSTVDWLLKTVNSSREMTVQTDAGIIVGKSIKIENYNFDRILEALNMSVRGLYFDSRGDILPADVPTFVFRMPWNRSLQMLDLLGKHRKSEPKMKGNNVVFLGEVNIDSENSTDSMWAICIYDAIVFVGVTGELWSSYFQDAFERLEKAASLRAEPDHLTIHPAPDGTYHIPLM
jgi:hypothetical protein